MQEFRLFHCSSKKSTLATKLTFSLAFPTPLVFFYFFMVGHFNHSLWFWFNNLRSKSTVKEGFTKLIHELDILPKVSQGFFLSNQRIKIARDLPR